MEIEVIVVAENEDFIYDVLYDNVIRTNINHGKPQLEYHNCHYIAPHWFNDKKKGIDRIFHILSMEFKDDFYEFKLGNSFILKESITNLEGNAKFRYFPLSKFNMKELSNGLLISNNLKEITVLLT